MSIVTLIANAIRFGTAFLFGSTGEILTEKSGHLNLGIPGVMCVGAFGGCYGLSLYIGAVGLENIKPVPAILIAILSCLLAGAIMGAIYSFLTVTLRSNQNVTGLAITTFGAGFANFFINKIDKTGFAQASKFFTTLFPFEDKLGAFGDIVFSHGILVYLAIAIAVTIAIVFKKTKIGLHLRAVGENPATADSAGINVTAYRYVATIIGSAIAGLGGLFYIMDYLGGSWEFTIDALGWLSIALVIFTVWRTDLAIIGSIVFGALYILPNYLSVSFSIMNLIEMVPYVITIIVLIVTSMMNKKENQPPAGLGNNYFREER